MVQLERVVQRGAAVVVARVDVGAARDQEPRDLELVVGAVGRLSDRL